MNEAIKNHALGEGRLVPRHDSAGRAVVAGAKLESDVPQNGMRINRAACQAPAADLAVNPNSRLLPEFGIVIFEKRHAPGFAASVMRQDFSEFLLVLTGQARLEGGERVFHLSPGSLVHAPADCDYQYQDKRGWPVTGYAIRYCDKVLSTGLTDRLARFGIWHCNLGRDGSPLLRTLPSICREMLHEQLCRQIGWETVLLARLSELVVHTARFGIRRMPLDAPQPQKSSDSLARVSQYAAQLRSVYSLPTTLDEAARTTGLSRRRFTALFRSLTGQSWHKYLLGLRLHHARHLLSDTDKNILSVAFESGFDDLSHFNHVFRQVVGCSPSEFRTKSIGPHSYPPVFPSPLLAQQPFESAASLATNGAALREASRPGCQT